ncbi:MAG: hypothetical protein WEB13_05930, partial [Dehalococcoidia bacterium]
GALDDADAAAIESTALFAKIREAQMAVEAPCLVAALAAFADGRVRAEGGRLLDAAGAPAPALDLTADVTARMRATSAH